MRATLRQLELCACGLRDGMLQQAHPPPEGHPHPARPHGPPALPGSALAHEGPWRALQGLDALETLDLSENELTHPPPHLPPKLHTLKVWSSPPAGLVLALPRRREGFLFRGSCCSLASTALLMPFLISFLAPRARAEHQQASGLAPLTRFVCARACACGAQLAGNRLTTLAYLERRHGLRHLDARRNPNLTALATLFALAPLKDALQTLHLEGCPVATTAPGYRRAVADLLPALQVG